MFIVTHRRFFFWFTGILLAASIAAMVAWGLPLGIDFTGGSSMQIAYTSERPSVDEVIAHTEKVGFDVASVRPFGENGMSIRTRTMTPEEHIELLSLLSINEPVQELSFTSIGPSLGGQFTTKVIWAIAAVLLGILLYIAYAFRRVSHPVPSWGYGLVAILMLIIDMIVPLGFFAAYAHYTGAEVDSLIVVAILALLGYVMNDIIVVFDRVREHLAMNEKEGKKEEFELTVGKSIRETLARSINTSLTTALVLVALMLFGAPATRVFALVMLVGVVAGTFSSICRSAPLLIPIARWVTKK
jgi:preprotein translocase subunit SecF